MCMDLELWRSVHRWSRCLCLIGSTALSSSHQICDRDLFFVHWLDGNIRGLALPYVIPNCMRDTKSVSMYLISKSSVHHWPAKMQQVHYVACCLNNFYPLVRCRNNEYLHKSVKWGSWGCLMFSWKANENFQGYTILTSVLISILFLLFRFDDYVYLYAAT